MIRRIVQWVVMLRVVLPKWGRARVLPSLPHLSLRFVLAALVVSLLTTFPGFLAAATIQYVYDELGRLVGAIDQNGDAAQYVYDPAGNITSILRFTSTQLALI